MKKLMNKKGFTLMEMLIVIAIIVILVAIAVPTFSSSLNDAKRATDEANLRGAKAAAVVFALDSSKTLTGEIYYDPVAGEIKNGAAPDTAKCGKCENHNGEYIKVTYSGTTPTVSWSGSATVADDACKK